MIKGKNKIDGKAMSPSMATLLEMEMQDDLSRARIDYPDLTKVKTNGEPVGRIMVVGIPGDLDTNGFENIWKRRNG